MDADASVKSRRLGRAQAIWSTLTADVSAGGGMSPDTRLEKALRIDDLRGGLLEHSRRAYSLIPRIDRPRILDIGCGSGLLTIELARMSAGDVVGIDVDESAIERLRRRAAQAGPSRRISAVNASLFDTGLPDESFDILWGEGALHLLEPCRSFPACRRLLKPGGFLVAGETVSWFESVQRRLATSGFRLVERSLPPQALLVDRLLRTARGEHPGASRARWRRIGSGSAGPIRERNRHGQGGP